MGANPYLTDEECALLERATIGIAGAGGLGSNCAMNLVRAGVKKLILCDFDVVSESNLNRQFFFRNQIGRSKVEALAENLKAIDPELILDLRPVRLDADSMRDLVASSDVVVEAFDKAEAKQLLISVALPAGKPLVTASGLAGWGRSAEIVSRRMGRNLVVVGDGSTCVSEKVPPQSPRVMLAAALEANAVLAFLLGYEL